MAASAALRIPVVPPAKVYLSSARSARITMSAARSAIAVSDEGAEALSRDLSDLAGLRPGWLDGDGSAASSSSSRDVRSSRRTVTACAMQA